MNDRCRHRPASLLIEQFVVAALAAPEPKFKARVGDERNCSVIHVGNLFELLRKSGYQGQSTNVLLEQAADSVCAQRSEERPNEVNDEGAFATADIFRPVYDVSPGRAGFVGFAFPPLAGNYARGMAAAARTALSDPRRLGARSQTLVRQPILDRRSRLQRAVLLRSDDGQASDGELGAIASPLREQA